MIPLENLIAHRAGAIPKLRPLSRHQCRPKGQVSLEEGVDALIVSPDQEVVEAALSVKSQRLEQTTTAEKLRRPRSTISSWFPSSSRALKKPVLATATALISSPPLVLGKACWSARAPKPCSWFTVKPFHRRSFPHDRFESTQAHLIPMFSWVMAQRSTWPNSKPAILFWRFQRVV